jgi:hypothetical protein
LLIPFLFSTQSSGAQALEKELINAVQTVGGIFGSIWIHEIGHAVTLNALGATDIKIWVPCEDRLKAFSICPC